MSRHEAEYGEGVCQRPEHRPGSDGITKWDSQFEREKHESVRRRHEEARQLCLQCPLLERCEDMVSFFEARGEAVDGVVAGRYSVVSAQYNGYRLIECRGCGAALRVSAVLTKRDRVAAKVHVGEQLCGDCYPRFSRRVRKAGREGKVRK